MSVIEVAIVGEDKDRLLPHLRVLREDVHDFGDIPRAIPRRGRVIGERFRRTQPRNRRQLALIHILAELVEDIALGNHHRLWSVAVRK